jgi:hypothetical protein
MKSIMALMFVLFASAGFMAMNDNPIKFEDLTEEQKHETIPENVWFVIIDGVVFELVLTKDIVIDIHIKTITLETRDVIFDDGFDGV